MAEIRQGYLDDYTQNTSGNIGIGTSSASDAKLEIIGGTTSQELNVTGIATFGSVSGFIKKHTDYAENVNITTGDSGTLSGEIVVGAGLTMTVGTAATASQGSVDSLKVFNMFQPPSGTTNQRPPGKPGALFYNFDFKTVEFFDGNSWNQVDNTTRRGRCVFFGGFISPGDRTDQIDYINAFTLGNAINFGTLGATTRMSFGGQSGNAIRGFCAGFWPSNKDLIEYVTIASSGNGIEFGNLTAGRQQGGVTSSSTRSVFAGGAGQLNTMEYVEIMTTGNALDFGDLSVARRALAGCGSPTRGIYSGGGDGNTIGAHDDYITIASKGDATKFRDCGFFCRNTKMASNSVRGVYALGLTVHPESKSQQILESITIATLGNVTYFGDMVAPTNDAAFIGAGNRGILAGGWSPDAPAITNTIQYVNITTAGNATDFGDYTRPTSQLAGTSDCHGGLGGF